MSDLSPEGCFLVFSIQGVCVVLEEAVAWVCVVLEEAVAWVAAPGQRFNWQLNGSESGRACQTVLAHGALTLRANITVCLPYLSLYLPVSLFILLSLSLPLSLSLFILLSLFLHLPPMSLCFSLRFSLKLSPFVGLL